MWLDGVVLMAVLLGIHGSIRQTRRFNKVGLPSVSDLLGYVSMYASSSEILCSKACVDSSDCRSFTITTMGDCRLYDVALPPGSNGDTSLSYYTRQGESIPCIQHIGFEYNGYQSVSATSRDCLRWDSISTVYPASSFIDGSLERAENFCREPLLLDTRPWCYVTNTTWQYCNTVGFCCLPYPAIHYTGQISRTLSGGVCQRWDSQSPHIHTASMDSYLQNYCRSFAYDNPHHTWCYTMNPAIRWELCAPKQCDDV